MNDLLNVIAGLPALIIELFILAWEHPFAALGLIAILGSAFVIGGLQVESWREGRQTRRRNFDRFHR